MSVFFNRRGSAYDNSILLSDFAEGDTVLINEDGGPIEFYVAKHNYESALNGNGRTLLVRKDCHSCQNGDNDGNAEIGFPTDWWLSGTYKGTLDSSVQAAMGTTNFYCTDVSTNKVITLNRALFLLSVTELGLSNNYANVEGSALPIASTLQADCVMDKGLFSDRYTAQWTRTRYTRSTYIKDNSFMLRKGVTLDWGDNSYRWSVRPCFTLPSAAKFDPETKEFLKGA